jgi:hypothetical protein
VARGAGGLSRSIERMPAAELVEVEPAQWDPLVRSLGVTDVYYSHGFVSASAPLARGAPTLLHAGGPGGDLLFACIVREDPVDVVTPLARRRGRATAPRADRCRRAA